jgi:hypothetical protein
LWVGSPAIAGWLYFVGCSLPQAVGARNSASRSPAPAPVRLSPRSTPSSADLRDP